MRKLFKIVYGYLPGTFECGDSGGRAVKNMQKIPTYILQPVVEKCGSSWCRKMRHGTVSFMFQEKLQMEWQYLQ